MTPEGARFVVERPPPGLARGLVTSPAWIVAVTGCALVLLTVIYFAWRLRRARRR